MPITKWSKERNAEFKKRWEAGMPHSELSKLYPDHSWRALANQAARIGAHRPPKQDAARPAILKYLMEHPNQTVVDLTRALPYRSDNVRYALGKLHKANQVRIVDYCGGGSVYAAGAGDDMTREEWRALRAGEKAKKKSEKPRLRKPMLSSNEARVIHTKAVPGMCDARRDPMVAALFGSV